MQNGDKIILKCYNDKCKRFIKVRLYDEDMGLATDSRGHTIDLRNQVYVCVKHIAQHKRMCDNL
jgi:hypothetical protein